MNKITPRFYTVHRPKKHSAHDLDSKILVPPQPTEIELVRKLAALGIDLKKYKYFNNRGDEHFLITNWERKEK